MEGWWCLDCQRPVQLNVYGRCEWCDSNAVDSMERLCLQFAPSNPVKRTVEAQTGIPQYAGTI